MAPGTMMIYMMIMMMTTEMVIIIMIMIIMIITMIIIIQFAWNPPAISHPESVLKYRLFYKQVTTVVMMMFGIIFLTSGASSQ